MTRAVAAWPRSAPALPSSRRRGRPLSSHLSLFAAIIVLPIWALVAFLLFQSASSERSRSVERTARVAHNIAVDVDRELASMVRTVQALATSPSLQQGDFAAFDRQARTLMRLQGNNIVVRDLTGQQLVNVAVPPGTPLPRGTTGSREADRRTIESGKPQISGLVIGAARQVPVFIVDVPIFDQNGQVAYLLDLSLETSHLTVLLGQEAMPEGWRASVFDANGVRLAGTTSAEPVETEETEALRDALARGSRQIEFSSPDGVAQHAALSRIELSGWTILVGVPSDVLLQPFWRWQLTVAALALLAVLLSAFAAGAFGRRIARQAHSLADAAAALSRGQPMHMQGEPTVRELMMVGGSLERAEIELGRRAADRECANQELRELNATLERRVAERTRELTANEERIRSIFNTMSQFMGLLSPTGMLLKINQTALDFGGFSRSAVTDQPIWSVGWWADEGERARLQLAVQKAAGGTLVRYETEIRGRRGRRAIIDFSLKPIRDARGAVAYLLAEGYDITERVEAEQRLSQSEEMLRQAQKLEAVGQLTGGIAHDFNNLLSAVIGNLDLLAARLGHDAKMTSLVQRAQQAAERGARLTAQLLAFARRQHLEAKRTDISELVRGMEDLLLRTLGGTVTIDHRLAPDLWPVIGDPNQIELGILNLALNARDAMPNGGMLTIETENVALESPLAPHNLPPGDYVRVSVGDTGTGMPDSVRAKAFDPFFTTKEVGKGSGLGLSMVLGLAQQHGGGVSIDSALEVGTVVHLFFPRAPQEASVVLPEAELPKATVRREPGCHVLVVDDEPDIRELMAECLTAMGHRVTLAPSGEAALAKLETGTFDLAMVDIAMPEMSGPAFVAAARARGMQLPVLFMTGYADVATLVDLGNATLLKKPFRMPELQAKLIESLGLAVPA